MKWRRASEAEFAEPPDRLGVDPVCFGPQTLRAGELPDLLGVDDGGRHPGLDQRPVQAALAAARRLQDDQHGLAVPDVTAPPRSQPPDASRTTSTSWPSPM